MFLNAEEQKILLFLRRTPEDWFGAVEICRRASTRRDYDANQRWALPYLQSLRDKKMVERDDTGHYRLDPSQWPTEEADPSSAGKSSGLKPPRKPNG